MGHSKDFWSTLKERNVVRVAAVYLGTAWFAVEVAKNLSEIFGAPPWVPRAVVGFLALGLPVTLVFSWIYETTPQQSRTSARRLDRLIAVVLALIVVALLVNRLVPGPSAGGLRAGKDLRHGPEIWRAHAQGLTIGDQVPANSWR